MEYGREDVSGQLDYIIDGPWKPGASKSVQVRQSTGDRFAIVTVGKPDYNFLSTLSTAF
jgi:hypothetical protein